MRRISAITLIFALACAGSAAFAKDHGNGNGKGHGKGQEKNEERGGPHADVRPGGYFTESQREAARRGYEEHYAGGKRCPPGLAKKNNGCMPPGQARKWAVGEPVPAGVVTYAVPQPVLVALPPPPMGFRYLRMGGDVVLVRINGNLVVDVMLNIFH